MSVRFRWQYTLRAVLLLTVVAACALYAPRAYFSRKEAAIRRMQALGAEIVFDYQWSPAEAWLPDAELPGNAWARAWLGPYYAAEPVELQLFPGRSMQPGLFTDADAELLMQFPELKWVVLYETALTDRGIESIAALAALERLDLMGSRQVTAAGIKRFQRARPGVRVLVD